MWWIAAGVLLLALMLQTTLMHYTRIRNVEASLVLVAVVWYALRADLQSAAIYGLAAGLLEDILATGTGAAWTISTTLCAIAASIASRGFFADSIPIGTTLVFAITLVRALIFWIVMGLEGYPSGLGALHFHEALFEALLNAILMAIVMLLARRFEDRFA